MLCNHMLHLYIGTMVGSTLNGSACTAPLAGGALGRGSDPLEARCGWVGDRDCKEDAMMTQHHDANIRSNGVRTSWLLAV